VRRLLEVDQNKRPSAEEAKRDIWITKYQTPMTGVEDEHDLSQGLRERFNPRAKWKIAINSTRAIGRFSRTPSSQSTQSVQSTDDEGEDEEGWHPLSMGINDLTQKSNKVKDGVARASEEDPWSNVNVVVTPPADSVKFPYSNPSSPTAIFTEEPARDPGFADEDDDNVSFATADDEMPLRIPGSFDMLEPSLSSLRSRTRSPPDDLQRGRTQSWGDFFRNFTLGSWGE